MVAESPFVEDSFALTPKNALRNIQSGHEIGAENLRTDVSIWIENPDDVSVVFISVEKQEPQRVVMEWENMTFGERAYFRCSCGLRVAKLLLPLGGKEFKCRKCHKLQYQLTRANRKSPTGIAIYRMHRLKKLADSRASMGRILYKGEYSARFTRFLRLCERAGHHNIVQGANALKALINN